MTIRINDTVIAEAQILQAMQYHQASSQREAMVQAAESLVIGELLRQRADTLGLDVDARDAQGELAYLDQLIDTEVALPEAHDEECRRYFDQNPGKFTTAPLIAASHILIGADPQDQNARQQAREQAEALIRILSGDPDQFASLASHHSDCPSKAQGGQLGQLTRGQTVAEFEKVLFLAPVGLIPHPVETRFGLHVARVDFHEPGRPLEFEMVAERIREYLNEKVRRKAIAQYIRYLASEATIEGFDFDAPASPLMQ